MANLNFELSDINKIESVYPIFRYNSLLQINYHFENLLNHKSKFKSIFINDARIIVAEFENNQPFFVSQLTSKHQNLFVLQIQDKCQIIRVDKNMENIILHIYDEIEYGVEDGCLAVKQNNLWGFINDDAVEIIKPQYENYCAFQQGYAAVCKNGKWGFINKNNELIIPFEYDIPDYSCFNNDIAPVSKQGRFAYIDIHNKQVTPFIYENALIMCDDSKLLPVKLNNKWGFIDKAGNEIIPFDFDDVENNLDNYPVHSVRKVVDNKKLYGIVDANSLKIIVPCEYLSVCVNDKSIQVKKQNKKYVLLNWDGSEISDEFDFIDEYSSDGLFGVRNNKKFGFINEKGAIIIPLEYDYCKDFYSGCSVVERDNITYIIDKNNTILFESEDCSHVYNTGIGLFIIKNISSDSILLDIDDKKVKILYLC